MANTATIRNANGLPATFAGSKIGQDDATFVFIKVGDEERRMRWAEWDALPVWTGPRPSFARNQRLMMTPLHPRGSTGRSRPVSVRNAKNRGTA
jgi:hypothetical protein